MVMNDTDSSWVGVRMREAIDTIENEYVRPSVMFRPHLVKVPNGWVAYHEDISKYRVHATGNSPDEAMRNFDKAWTTQQETKKPKEG